MEEMRLDIFLILQRKDLICYYAYNSDRCTHRQNLGMIVSSTNIHRPTVYSLVQCLISIRNKNNSLVYFS